jgi:methionyl-tRNA formyltransferase
MPKQDDHPSGSLNMSNRITDSIKAGKKLLEKKEENDAALKVARKLKEQQDAIDFENALETSANNIMDSLPERIMNTLASGSNLLISEIKLSAPSEELTGLAKKVHQKLTSINLKPGVVHCSDGNFYTFIIRKERLLSLLPKSGSL